MRIDDLPPIHLNPALREIEPPAKTTESFADWLTEEIGTVNQKLLGADEALHQLAAGQAVSLHQTMLTLEEAKLSFQFLEQIRNRLMSAYQDILREQI